MPFQSLFMRDTIWTTRTPAQGGHQCFVDAQDGSKPYCCGSRRNVSSPSPTSSVQHVCGHIVPSYVNMADSLLLEQMECALATLPGGSYGLISSLIMTMMILKKTGAKGNKVRPVINLEMIVAD